MHRHVLNLEAVENYTTKITMRHSWIGVYQPTQVIIFSNFCLEKILKSPFYSNVCA